MNTNTNAIEEEHFAVEDMMSYSNIEITHANDNKVPIKIIVSKAAFWLAIIVAILCLFLF